MADKKHRTIGFDIGDVHTTMIGCVSIGNDIGVRGRGKGGAPVIIDGFRAEDNGTVFADLDGAVIGNVSATNRSKAEPAKARKEARKREKAARKKNRQRQ